MSRIYFGQYDSVWSLSRVQAIELCRKVLAGQPYNLDEEGRCLSPSYHVPKHLVHRCLDWSADDWATLLADITEKESA
jgi:hypothetical protein